MTILPSSSEICAAPAETVAPSGWTAFYLVKPADGSTFHPSIEVAVRRVFDTRLAGIWLFPDELSITCFIDEEKPAEVADALGAKLVDAIGVDSVSLVGPHLNRLRAPDEYFAASAEVRRFPPQLPRCSP